MPIRVLAVVNEHSKIIVSGSQPAFRNKISASRKQELQLILNEIMVNMKKHSRAKKVPVVFRQENDKGMIIYKDDGAGFRSGLEFGNGLKNTVSRIKSLNGEVNFEKTGKRV